ncbi:MAG: class I SAM-dependent methyltransferase [candidate division Zixibacteria bacterium]
MTDSNIGKHSIHIIYDKDFWGYGLVFDNNGIFKCALRPSDIGAYLQVVDSQPLIIDPMQQCWAGSSGERKAVNHLNLYFSRLFGSNSPFIDTYAIFGKYLSPLVNKFLIQDPILDLGSGPGNYFNGKSEILSLDLCIKNSQQIPSDEEIIGLQMNGDAGDLPFKNEVFGSILCSFVLEHVPDPNRAVGEISRVLRRNGVVIISYPSMSVIEVGKRMFSKERPTIPIFHQRTFGLFSMRMCFSTRQIIKTLVSHKFRIIKVIGVKPLPAENILASLLNNFLSGLYPFKYLGSQTIMIAQKK